MSTGKQKKLKTRINLGKGIKAVRADKNLTQDGAAKKLGYSNRGCICNLEKQENTQTETIERVADGLEVDLEEFLKECIEEAK